MIFNQAEFVVSVADYKLCPDEGIIEIAIAGKSNVGKSSFINMLANHNKLAKTSRTPGRTRLLNYFRINKGEFMLVDLPGYGFAKVNHDEKDKWGQLIEGYFAKSAQLAHVIVLLDIRHEPTTLDKQMIAYLHHYNIPFTLVATKADKLSRLQQNRQRKIIADCLCQGVGNILVTSAETKLGVSDVLARFDLVLEEHKGFDGNALTDE